MRPVIREVLETLLLTVLIFILVRTTVQASVVPTGSMEPSIQPGQRLLINKVVYFSATGGVLSKLPFVKREGERTYLFHAPSRGEVIVFRPPVEPDIEYVKRVVATPGETVEIREGKVFVNGRPLKEPYILEPPRYTMALTVVPAASYFVMGDNRNNSADSHVWGVVPAQNIIGKAWFIYWPVSSWGLVPNYSVNAIGG